MDRVRDIEIFLAIVANRSLAGAGRKLSMSPPAVTRALSRLENRLGTSLVVRTTRSLVLTEAGETFAQRGQDVIDALAAAEHAVSEDAEPHGTLKITAPRQLGRIVVAPIVRLFLDRFRNARARLILQDRIVHLLDEGIDLGVRIGHLEDTSAKARRVGEVRQLLLASPTYLDGVAPPHSTSDLQRHRLIAFTGRLYQGRLRVRDGTVAFAPVHIEVDCAATAMELAEAGAGLVPLWSYQCAASARAGRLLPLLEDEMPAPTPCHLIWPERRFENTLVRAFVDFAAPRLREHLRASSVDRVN